MATTSQRDPPPSQREPAGAVYIRRFKAHSEKYLFVPPPGKNKPKFPLDGRASVGPAHEAFIEWEAELEAELPGDKSIPVTDVHADWMNLFMRGLPIPAPRTWAQRRAKDGWIITMAEFEENDGTWART